MGLFPNYTPLPTVWRGWHFRSRLEGRWAIALSAIGIEFQYEPEGFSVDGEPYLPDFYLPQVRMFAEVKPICFNEREKRLILKLSDATNCAVLMLVGPPDFKTYNAIHPVRLKDGETERFETDYLLDIDWHGRKHFDDGRLFGCTGWECNVTAPEGSFSPEYRAAVFASRTHRFEEGGKF